MQKRSPVYHATALDTDIHIPYNFEILADQYVSSKIT